MTSGSVASPFRLADQFRRLRRRGWLWLPALAMLGMLLIALRGPIADALWPESRADALRRQAEEALRSGHLTATDGSGARELFQAAIAIDPDRVDAHSGLARVAQAAVRQARLAAERGDFADAHAQLSLARSLAAPRAQTEAVAEILRRREVAGTGIDDLLRRADAARAAGRLDGHADAALPLYRRILTLQPRRTEALEGREDALTALLQQARTALARGDLAEGARIAAAAAVYDNGHGDLPDTRARLTQAAERTLRDADADLRRGRLQRADAGYRRWLAAAQAGGEIFAADSATRAAVDTGVLATARAYAKRARRATADLRLEPARDDLRHAYLLLAELPLAPAETPAELVDAAQALDRAERLQRRSVVAPANAAARAKVRTLLDQAAAAETRGDWLTPPGESAYDSLRAARALAPDDPAVRRAAARLLPKARECFERELRDNRLLRARVCFDTWIALDGERRALADARRRLALRWLQVGEERLGAGELDSAQRALDAARSLDPRVPGLADFAARVRAAGVAKEP